MIKCKVCKFWDNQNEDLDKGKGLCRVLPPVPNQALGFGMWPSTFPNDSCGAGKPK